MLRVNSMYDGDSVHVQVFRNHTMPSSFADFGFGDIVTIPAYIMHKEMDVSVRMYGFDCPELRDKRPDFKAAAYLARDKAREWMEDGVENCNLYLFTHKDKTGKYGRYLGNFYKDKKNNEAPSYLKDYLIENHLAVPYHNENKQLVQDSHQKNIDALKEKGLI